MRRMGRFTGRKAPNNRHRSIPQIGGGGGGTVTPTLATPTLDLVSGQAEYPPQFSVLWPLSLLPTDKAYLQIANDFAFLDLVADEYQVIDEPPVNNEFNSLASVLSGEHYFRLRVERNDGVEISDWTSPIKHGDITPPTITSSTTFSGIEGQSNPTFTCTANEPVTWSITGGADGGKVDINATTGVGYVVGTTDYFFGQRNFIFIVTATDFAGNQSSQTVTYSVLPNWASPPLAQWSSTAGFNKTSNSTVSGTPPLHMASTLNGNPGFIRCVRQTQATKFQVEHTIDELGQYGYFAFGVDDGLKDYSNTLYTGQGSITNVGVQITNGYQAYFVNNLNVLEDNKALAVGDVIGYRCDKGGSIEFYKVSGGVLTVLASRSFIPFLSGNFFAFGVTAGWQYPCSMTANFGATAYARALSNSYGVY